EREIAAIPPLPTNAPAARLSQYRAARDAELARLEPQRAGAKAALNAIPTIEAPPPSIDANAKWAILTLVEALKALALWAIVSRRSAVAASASAAQPINPASALAMKRWGKVQVASN